MPFNKRENRLLISLMTYKNVTTEYPNLNRNDNSLTTILFASKKTSAHGMQRFLRSPSVYWSENLRLKISVKR
jgi:hypothetical protein